LTTTSSIEEPFSTGGIYFGKNKEFLEEILTKSFKENILESLGKMLLFQPENMKEEAEKLYLKVENYIYSRTE
jgi:hypothetical protein